MYIYAKRPTGRCSIDTNEVAMVCLMTADEYLGDIGTGMFTTIWSE